MTTLIRTDHVPAADLVDFLREVMARTWLPMECRPERGTDYCAEFRASGLGPMQVVVMDVPPATVRRTPALIAEADPDLLKMVLVRGGCCVVSQDGRQARLLPGFVSGQWLLDPGSKQGLGVVVFSSAEAAADAAGGPRGFPRDDARAWNVEDVAVYEQVSSA